MIKKPKILRTCLTCNVEFFVIDAPSRLGRGKYCSHKCSAFAQSYKHGHAAKSSLKATSTYRTWNAMKQRCTNPNHEKFPTYGAMGITVCSSWNEFDNFLLDMGERPKDKTIDRIDSSLGYFKENCKWSNISEQQRNLKNNINITHLGVTKCLSEWAKDLGINTPTLYYRIKSGWSVADAFNPEKQYSKK